MSWPILLRFTTDAGGVSAGRARMNGLTRLAGGFLKVMGASLTLAGLAVARNSQMSRSFRT